MIIAQIFRIISAVFGITADRSSDSKKILFYNGISNFFSAIQYFLLNAYTGAISSIVAIGRNALFYKFPKKVPIVLLLLYYAVLILLNLPQYNGIISVIPVLLVIMYSTVLYIGNVKVIKYSVIVICLLEILYDYYCKAYVGIAVCLLDILFVSISLVEKRKVLEK